MPAVPRSNPLYVESQAPPSSYAIADMIEGKPGALPRVAKLTALRSVFLVPGLYVAGIRGVTLLRSAGFGSVSLSLYLLGLYSLRKRRYEASGHSRRVRRRRR